MSNHAICAIATPHGTSALGIVRLSGSNIQEIISPYIDKQLQDRRAVLTSFRSGNSIIDGCIIILYRGLGRTQEKMSSRSYPTAII